MCRSSCLCLRSCLKGSEWVTISVHNHNCINLYSTVVECPLRVVWRELDRWFLLISEQFCISTFGRLIRWQSCVVNDRIASKETLEDVETHGYTLKTNERVYWDNSKQTLEWLMLVDINCLVSDHIILSPAARQLCSTSNVWPHKSLSPNCFRAQKEKSWEPGHSQAPSQNITWKCKVWF